MSSTERVPEPTMEDILASIRRIIPDDEAGQATPTKPGQKAQAEEETIEGEADNRIIDDIARVLGGSAEPANQDEEILNLTAELGGLEIVEDEVSESAETIEIVEVAEVLELEEIEFVSTAPEPAEPAAPSAADVPAFDAVPQDLVPQDLATEGLVPEDLAPDPEPAAPVATPEPVAAAPETAVSASEEAASALERAIAALKAGQVPASSETPAEPFQFEAASQPEQTPAADATLQDEAISPETIPMAMPMLAPDADTHPDPEARLAPEVDENLQVALEPASSLEPLEDDIGAEAELVLTEAGTEETVIEPEKPTFWPAEADQESSLQEPPSNPELESNPLAEPASARVNGSGVHQDEGVSRTLEDSIKDMLRPMLRQWLDYNMPRMIREELDADALRRHRD